MRVDRQRSGKQARNSVEQTMRRLRRLSETMDSAIRLPGGYRIGVDGIIGLIPGFGDTAGAIVSSYIIAEAARLGVPSRILALMIYNVLVEAIVGFIPVLGDLFDFAWKANLRNVRLLERHMGEHPGGPDAQRRLMHVVLVVLVLLVGGIIAVSLLVIAGVISLFA